MCIFHGIPADVEKVGRNAYVHAHMHVHTHLTQESHVDGFKSFLEFHQQD